MEQVQPLSVEPAGFATAVLRREIPYSRLRATFPESQAAIQLRNQEVAFCSVGVAELGRDFVLVRMESHGLGRELELAPARIFRGPSEQYNKKNVVKLDVWKVGDHRFLIFAPSNLSPGEYILSLGPGLRSAWQGPSRNANLALVESPAAVKGFDFGFNQR